MYLKNENTLTSANLDNTGTSTLNTIKIFEVTIPHQTTTKLEKILIAFGKLMYYLKHDHTLSPNSFWFPDSETELSYESDNFGVVKIKITVHGSSYNTIIKITEKGVLIPVKVFSNGEHNVLLFKSQHGYNKKGFVTVLESQNSILVSDFGNTIEINWNNLIGLI